MALFSFNRNTNTSNDNTENVVQEIQLIINDEVVKIPAAEVQGMTVAQVFQKFASDVADVNRINRYVAQGRIVDGSSYVSVGTVYSGAISSESKG